jgi:pimeloyl-ACP methyl ester carboxylesterase
MQDPDLGQRLARMTCSTLVLWGESDRVVSPEYGRAFAAAIPNSRFELIAECGHLPQIEQAETSPRPPNSIRTRDHIAATSEERGGLRISAWIKHLSGRHVALTLWPVTLVQVA